MKVFRYTFSFFSVLSFSYDIGCSAANAQTRVIVICTLRFAWYRKTHFIALTVHFFFGFSKIQFFPLLSYLFVCTSHQVMSYTDVTVASYCNVHIVYRCSKASTFFMSFFIPSLSFLVFYFLLFWAFKTDKLL